MGYINTAYLFKCQTCRHFRSDECNTFCENGECYSPNMFKIPTADVVEVKHGEWIDRDESYWETRCTCSNCNKDGITIDGYPVHTDYCPNCGAKMDGDK